MPNQHVFNRLEGIQQVLIGIYTAGKTSSSATKGREREDFIDHFLSAVFPKPFRFGSGDITDLVGNRSGQIDVVVEYPFLPSLPITSDSQERLYFAEGVAAAIEVKSNLSSQWDEVVSTWEKLKILQRKFGSSMSMGNMPGTAIPLLAVGYTGWSKLDTLKNKIDECGIGGILIIDKGLFVSSDEFSAIMAEGPLSLLALISCLHKVISSLKMISANPINYGT